MKQKIKVAAVVCLACLSVLCCRAQDDPDRLYTTSERQQVDTAMLDCIYLYAAADTVLAQTKEIYTILQTGREWTKFMSYESYWTDSLLNSRDWKITVREFEKLEPPVRGYFPDQYLRSVADNVYEVQGMVFVDFYVYEDSVATPAWTLSTDTATVCGYLCRKATARFRGRQWEAWYTEEIPVDAGPWKLCGLPGLILRASTPDGLLSFEAQSVRRGGAYPVMQEVPSERAQRISRADVLTLERYAALEHDEYMSSRIELLYSANGSGFPKRTFYQPLELE